MASVEEPLRRDPFADTPKPFDSVSAMSLPILSTSSGPSAGDPMDVSHPTPSSMGPPTSSPGGDRMGEQDLSAQNEQQSQAQQSANGGAPPPVGAAAAAQQPKVVQTAFIHKLYNMLEDQGIQHLISWSSTSESFVMSPSSEFSKVLAQYFKHTNISSFVRQLNMYGFHKVSDVFHTGSPDSPLWEFKHGAGNFKRGDLAGLREIKRRASRHALIHRDSFSGASKIPTQQPPGTPIGETMQDPVEARLHMLEWNSQEAFARLARSEEAHAVLNAKYQTVLEGLQRCHQWNHELSSHLLAMLPDPDNPIHREVYATRQAITRHIDQLRTMDDPSPEPLFTHKQSFFQNTGGPLEPAMPVSPRQRPFDESRRPSFQGPLKPPPARGPVPAYMQGSPRRYGSIGTGNGSYSPSATRTTYPPPPPPPPPPTAQPQQVPQSQQQQQQQPPSQQQQQQQHPLATMTSPPSNLPRRHTSADIRLQGWDGGQPPPPPPYHQGTSPYASGQSSSVWPSSPRTATNTGDQQIRDALAQYELPRSSHVGSRQPSPGPHDAGPPTFTNSFAPSYANSTNDAGWQLPGARFPFKGLETPGPPTRRSSMASNVHSLLNPADTAERDGEEDGTDERKRKRLL